MRGIEHSWDTDRIPAGGSAAALPNASMPIAVGVPGIPRNTRNTPEYQSQDQHRDSRNGDDEAGLLRFRSTHQG